MAVSVFLSVRAFAAGQNGATFLEIPVGAGPAAMGSAYSTLAANAYAPVWNPAGLAFLPEKQLAGQHLSYLEGINHEYASFVAPLGAGGGLGVSAQYLTTGSIPQTTNSGALNGTFSSHYGAYSLAYGHRFFEQASFGATFKFIEAAISDVSAKTAAADLGTMFRLGDSWAASAGLRNLGGSLRFLSGNDRLPVEGYGGVACHPSPLATFSAEVVQHQTGLTAGRFGAEWRPMEAIALRAGYKTDTLKELSAVAGITTGVGLYAWGQEFSYAFLPYGDLGTTQYFSAVLHFGDRRAEKRNFIEYRSIRRHRLVSQPYSSANDAEDVDHQELMRLLENGTRDLSAKAGSDE